MDWRAWVSDGENDEPTRVSDRLTKIGNELMELWQAIMGVRSPDDELAVPPIGAEAEKAVEQMLRQERNQGVENVVAEQEDTVTLRQDEVIDGAVVFNERGRNVTGEPNSGREVRSVGDLSESLVSADTVAVQPERAATTEAAVWRQDDRRAIRVFDKSHPNGRLKDNSVAGNTADMLAVGSIGTVENMADEVWSVGKMRDGLTADGGVFIKSGEVGGSVNDISGLAGMANLGESARARADGLVLSDWELERICERVAERISEEIEIYLQSASMRG